MAEVPTGNPYNPIITAQQYPTMMGASGSVGTNDTTGTAEPVRVGVNPATGGVYVHTIGGGASDPASGTLNTLGTVGTVIGVGTVSNVGSITDVNRLYGGTIQVGTFVMPTGTVTTIAAGTQNTLGTVGVVNSIAAGTQQTLGTVGTLLGQGTITNLGSTTNVGQIHNAGTIQAGTVQINKVPVSIGTAFHTRGTTGGAVWGTLIAASGAGTRQYVSNVDIIVVSGTVDVAVTNVGVDGSAGAGVLARGQFIPSAGIAKQFDPVTRSGTNGTLSYWLGGAGTVDINIHYWQGV